MSGAFDKLDELKNKANKRGVGSLSSLELAVLRIDSITAADELAYLQACAAAIEDLSHIDATDATIAMFFKRDAKKLAKMRRTK